MSELETETAGAQARAMEAQTAELALPEQGGGLEEFGGGFRGPEEYDAGESDGDGYGGDEYDAGEIEVRGSDADLLAIPPRVDDLGAALAARPQRTKLPKVTTGLVAAVLLCGGFLGGVLLQKHEDGSSSARGAGFSFAGAGGTGTGTGTGAGGTGRTGRGGFGGFGGGTGTGTGTGAGAGGAAGGGSAITGTVTVVSGNTVYVTASDGSVYTVTTNGSTAISIAQTGTISQLKPGQKVVVSGSGDSNGNVTATSITAGSSGTGASPSSTSTSSTGQ
ncbi:MAG TPA: DUF5666 domain-containing protein [Actinocrinis sp.]|nr:DUF5666 domain-containing protein [Actinocrinis sp.]